MDYDTDLDEMEEEQETGEQPQKSRADHLKPWQFQPGKSGNPDGRPKGSISLKEWARRMLYEMNDEEKIEFLKGLDKKTIWEMTEGKPEQKADVTSKGERIAFLPSEIMAKHNIDAAPSDTEDSSQ